MQNTKVLYLFVLILIYSTQSVAQVILEEAPLEKTQNIQKEAKTKKSKRDFLNVKISSGLKHSGIFTAYQIYYNGRNVYPQKLSPRLGLELEYILPFTHKGWRIFIEPTIQNYQTRERGSLNHFHSSVELAFGLRYFKQIHANLATFLNIMYVRDKRIFHGFSTPQSHGFREESDTKSTIDMGLGVKLFKKVSVEFRYHGPRHITQDIFKDNPPFSSSLIIGYSIF